MRPPLQHRTSFGKQPARVRTASTTLRPWTLKFRQSSGPKRSLPVLRQLKGPMIRRLSRVKMAPLFNRSWLKWTMPRRLVKTNPKRFGMQLWTLPSILTGWPRRVVVLMRKRLDLLQRTTSPLTPPPFRDYRLPKSCFSLLYAWIRPPRTFVCWSLLYALFKIVLLLPPPTLRQTVQPFRLGRRIRQWARCKRVSPFSRWLLQMKIGLVTLRTVVNLVDWLTNTLGGTWVLSTKGRIQVKGNVRVSSPLPWLPPLKRARHRVRIWLRIKMPRTLRPAPTSSVNLC